MFHKLLKCKNFGLTFLVFTKLSDPQKKYHMLSFKLMPPTGWNYLKTCTNQNTSLLIFIFS